MSHAIVSITTIKEFILFVIRILNTDSVTKLICLRFLKCFFKDILFKTGLFNIFYNLFLVIVAIREH